MLALAVAPSYAAAAVAIFFLGMGVGGFQSLNGAVIVRTTEPAYFGRVISLTMIAFAAFGLMGLPIGLLADAIGDGGTLVAMSVSVCAIAALVGTLLYRARAAT